MLFFVEAQKQLIPTITIAQAIRNYYKFIGEEVYDENSSMVNFSRMRESLIDFNYEAATQDCRHTNA